METLTIRKPDDMHVHLRWGDMLELVLPFTTRYFARAIVMPNLTSQGMVINAKQVNIYRQFINSVVKMNQLGNFIPLMTIRLTPETSPEIIKEAKEAGAVAAKLYPAGVTTGAEKGITKIAHLFPVFQAMQQTGMILSIHAEKPSSPFLRAEEDYITVLDEIVAYCPNLRMVIEHVSTIAMLRWVKQASENVAATITPHHLTLNTDAVFGQPHNFCKPVAKSESDRQSLIQTVISGDHKFFLGTDSAPHPQINKEGAKAAAGIFNAPLALALLAEIFEENNALNRLENFTSVFGARFYNLLLNQETITLKRKSWVIPDSYGEVVPFLTGQMISWQV